MTRPENPIDRPDNPFVVQPPKPKKKRAKKVVRKVASKKRRKKRPDVPVDEPHVPNPFLQPRPDGVLTDDELKDRLQTLTLRVLCGRMARYNPSNSDISASVRLLDRAKRLESGKPKAPDVDLVDWLGETEAPEAESYGADT